MPTFTAKSAKVYVRNKIKLFICLKKYSIAYLDTYKQYLLYNQFNNSYLKIIFICNLFCILISINKKKICWLYRTKFGNWMYYIHCISFLLNASALLHKQLSLVKWCWLINCCNRMTTLGWSIDSNMFPLKYRTYLIPHERYIRRTLDYLYPWYLVIGLLFTVFHVSGITFDAENGTHRFFNLFRM